MKNTSNVGDIIYTRFNSIYEMIGKKSMADEPTKRVRTKNKPRLIEARGTDSKGNITKRASIKKPHESDVLEDWQEVEYVKCFKNPIYFIENFVYIQTDKGSALFKLRKYQKKIIKSLVANDYSILLQPRQSGKSTLIVAFYLWMTCFFQDKVIGMAAHKGKNAIDLIKRFKYAYEFLPSWIKPAVIEYNKHQVEFDNHSTVISATTTDDTFRGFTLTGGLYLDEFAFVEPRIAEEFWTSILPSLSGGELDGKKVIITSTPNTSEGLFAELWFGAERGDNGFAPIQVFSGEVPGRTEAFKKKMLQKMTATKYAQEFECAFVSDKGTLIQSSCLERLPWIEPVKVIDDIDFYGVVARRELVLGIDVAEGIGAGGDYSVIQIFDKKTFEQVGEFRDNNMNLTDFAKKIIKVLILLDKMKCRQIYYTIESNPIGMGVIHLLQNSDHPILDDAEFVSQRKKKGILMTNPTKLKGCSRLKDLVESHAMTIHSRALLSELKFFVKKGASFAAESGKKDDLAMGAVLTTLCLSEMARYDDDCDEKMNNMGAVALATEDDSEDLDALPFVF